MKVGDLGILQHLTPALRPDLFEGAMAEILEMYEPGDHIRDIGFDGKKIIFRENGINVDGEKFILVARKAGCMHVALVPQIGRMRYMVIERYQIRPLDDPDKEVERERDTEIPA